MDFFLKLYNINNPLVFWAAVTATIALLGLIGGFIKWLLNRLEKKRNEGVREVLEPPPDTSTSPINPIDISHEIQAFDNIFKSLDNKTQKFLAILDAFGGDSFTLEVVASITQLSELECKKRINQLINLSIVQKPSEERYKLHSRFKSSKKQELHELKDKIILEKIADYYLDLIQRKPNHIEVELLNVFSAMDWCFENKKWQKVIDFMWAIDDFHYLKWDWGSRITRFRQAIKASEEVKDYSNIVRFKDKLGYLTMHQGNFEAAESLFKDTLKINKEVLKNEARISSSFHSLGRVAEAKGNYGKARKLYNESLKISRTLSNKTSMADTLHELGVIAYRMKDYEEAKRQYEEALEIEREIGYKRIMSCTIHGLALLFGSEDYKEKDYRKAERLYEESLKIKRDLNDLEEIARTLYQLAQLYKMQRKYKKALPLCKESVEIFEKLDHRYTESARDLLKEIKLKI